MTLDMKHCIVGAIPAIEPGWQQMPVSHMGSS